MVLGCRPTLSNHCLAWIDIQKDMEKSSRQSTGLIFTDYLKLKNNEEPEKEMEKTAYLQA